MSLLKRVVVLPFADGWCVWNNRQARISEGVYSDRGTARDVAGWFNRVPTEGDRDWFADVRRAGGTQVGDVR